MLSNLVNNRLRYYRIITKNTNIYEWFLKKKRNPIKKDLKYNEAQNTRIDLASITYL